jgi:rhodanese-related sulfurtransferase
MNSKKMEGGNGSMGNNEIFVDVRPPEVYKEGHIPGAVNIPLDVLETLVSRLSDKNASISVYCQDGIRSAKGAKLLKELGYKNVRIMGR